MIMKQKLVSVIVIRSEIVKEYVVVKQELDLVDIVMTLYLYSHSVIVKEMSLIVKVSVMDLML